MAIAATMLKDADIYFFDEPSSYLDIYQRLQVAKVIQSLSREKYVVVVEHDLAVLDFLAETVFLMYGEEGAYGIIAQPRPVRTAINVYFGGYLKEENIRFRDRAIGFDTRPPRADWKAETLVTFGELTKRFDDFQLTVHPGRLHVVRGRVATRRHRALPRSRCGYLLDRRALRLPRFEPAHGGGADDPPRHGEGGPHRPHRGPRCVFPRHGLGQPHGLLRRSGPHWRR